MSTTTSKEDSTNYNERFYNWFWDYANIRGVKPVTPSARKGKTIFFSTGNLEAVFGLVDPSESPRKLRNVAFYALDLGKAGTTCYFYLCLTAMPGITTGQEAADRVNTLKRYTGIVKSMINENTGAIKPNVFSNIIKASTFAPDAFTKENLTKETIAKMINALIAQDEKWFGSADGGKTLAKNRKRVRMMNTMENMMTLMSRSRIVCKQEQNAEMRTRNMNLVKCTTMATV